MSNLGNVKSLGNDKHRKEKILKPKNNGGYMQVALSRNGNHKFYFVHRLVAKAFIPNPNDYPIINHKDENPKNNNVDNLEFCTYKYNSNYGNARHKISIGNGKKIGQYDLNGGFIKAYDSVRVAGKSCNIVHQSISDCCRGKLKKVGGFVWKYV